MMKYTIEKTPLNFGALLGEDKLADKVSRHKLNDEQYEHDLEMQLELLQKKVWNTPPLASRFDSSHRKKACQILRALCSPSSQIKRPKFTDDNERILTYELTVSILKYSSFLNDALHASSFEARYPNLMKYGLEEVLVTMYDLLERNFRMSPKDQPLQHKFALLQDAVLDSRTKVMAHMARLRIKHEAATYEYLLPENLRHQHNIDKNPLYVWVNLKKITLEEIIDALQNLGLTRTKVEDDILIQEDYFCADLNHEDLIRLHSKNLEIINRKTNLVTSGKIVIQDKSACMYVYSLVKALYFKERMTLEGHLQSRSRILQNTQADDWFEGIFDPIGKYVSKPNCVVVTNTGSGRSVAHLACLLQEAVPRYISQNIKIDSKDSLAQALRKRFARRPPLSVVAFGVSPDKLEEITNFIKKQANIQNVRLYAEEFTDIEPTDPRVAGCCAVLVNPPSSGSALKDPVAYVCSEGGDENVLMHLSTFVHSSREGPTQLPTVEQSRFLKHALNFPQAKLILYTTCSVLKVENADVVNACFHEALELEDKRKLRILQDILQRKSPRNYRDINFEFVDMQMVMDNYPKNFFKGKMIDKAPCSASSGVYIAIIRRTEKVLYIGRNSSSSTTKSVPVSGTSTTIDSPASSKLVNTLPLQLPLGQILSTTDLTNLSVTSALYNYATGKINDVQLDLYLSTKLGNINRNQLTPNVLSKKSSSDLVSKLKATAALKSQSQSKRNLSHKAIVQRVSTPTHASLLKKTQKWMTVYDRNNRNYSRGNTSSFQGLRETKNVHDHPVNGPPLCSQCNPSFNLDRSCVCARHAKKFPDFKPT